MKKLFFAIFSLSFLLLTFISLAQIQYFELEGSLDEKGLFEGDLIITVKKQLKNFEILFFSPIEDFSYSSNFPASCSLKIGEVSSLECNTNLEKEFGSIFASFKTKGFVRKIGEKFFFKFDFSSSSKIDNLVVYVKLPEGFLVSKGSKVVPTNYRLLSDGRRIIITWPVKNVSENKIMSFLVFYEPVKKISFPFWYYVLFGILVALVVILFFLLYKRKKFERKAFLSVLDKNEKKVFDVLLKHKGKVYQKKIVEETDFSKAKVTRILKSLEERGLVEIERLGRKNLVRIKKK